MANFLGKKNKQYICELCNLQTNNKKDFNKHITTAKHLKTTTGNIFCVINGDKKDNIPLACQCGKTYKHHSSLWKHKKTCSNKNNQSEINEMVEQMSEKQLIKELLMQNQQLIFENKEFKEMMFEQSNKMLEIATKPSTINNINTSNNQFNLQVFLNDKCKNAMNMSDFLDTIQIEQDDFENIGKLGYIQGISNIFIKNLKDLDETVRPMHCNDIKRETIYIKDNDIWDIDENKKRVKHAIAMIAHKNFKYIPVWTESNPGAFDATNKKNDLYMKISNQVTTCITPDDESGINKIIRNIANNVCINKKT